MKRLQSLKTKLTRPMRRFLADEGGATLTEFIITLPIFILIFAGIANLSRLNTAVVRTSGVAYATMWDNALEVQKDTAGIHTSVGHAGSAIKANMTTYRDKQEEDYVHQVVRRETNAQGSGLASKGTLGESEARVRSTHKEIKLRWIHADVTSNIQPIVGDSTYGKRLFDDGSSAPRVSFNSSNGFGTGTTGLTGSKPRLAHATSAHYGEEMGTDTQTVTIAGQQFHIYQYYNTLVSPRWQREDAAGVVARGALKGISAYDNLLGIAETQRLTKQSQTVNKIKGAME
ncbi:TadE/TadG family type IV pilus assembly protein [Bradymonas sediminis]|uniref:Uncharacterized protein n=1 Tax=Bradymonas sediminis TaxID=1548548 RepID=A0A2Z4FNZ8_9DELT|nr:TadE family protein [Bradymonas sediminis]AWV90709.1 hypothetical protein DN745_15855 [Bradymonas sediminis]TDP62650.1 hypothetical protein DFR33_11255 [Bradymonas sediminis]